MPFLTFFWFGELNLMPPLPPGKRGERERKREKTLQEYIKKDGEEVVILSRHIATQKIARSDQWRPAHDIAILSRFYTTHTHTHTHTGCC